MPSRSLGRWAGARADYLDAGEALYLRARAGAGSAVSGQLAAHHFVVMLSSQFQAFCRDLYMECVDAIVGTIPPALQDFFRTDLAQGRKLATGNPNPGNIGSDFGRLGVRIWPRLVAADRRTEARQRTLETMNLWRNAIGHEDFNRPEFGGRRTVPIRLARSFRRACSGLAATMDVVMRAHLTGVLPTEPWGA